MPTTHFPKVPEMTKRDYVEQQLQVIWEAIEFTNVVSRPTAEYLNSLYALRDVLLVLEKQDAIAAFSPQRHPPGIHRANHG
jgi:hypothetical protein